MGNPKAVTTITYENLPVEDLKIEKYQRVLNVPFAKSIGYDFDANLVGVIIVSYRDGRYNVVDGQTRVYGARIAGIPMLHCQVQHGLTYQQEADLFRRLCRQRKGILAFDYFNAGIEAVETESVEIKEIVEMNGLTIARGSGRNSIQALRALGNIYRKNGKEHLNTTLELIKETWDGEEKSLNNSMLTGVSEFLNYYSEDITLSKFAKQLRKWDPIKGTQ